MTLCFACCMLQLFLLLQDAMLCCAELCLQAVQLVVQLVLPVLSTAVEQRLLQLQSALLSRVEFSSSCLWESLPGLSHYLFLQPQTVVGPILLGCM